MTARDLLRLSSVGPLPVFSAGSVIENHVCLEENMLQDCLWRNAAISIELGNRIIITSMWVISNQTLMYVDLETSL